MRNLLLSIFFVGLAACGSDDPYGGGGGDAFGQASQLTVSTSAPSIPSDGTAPATITAFARDASNNLVPNVPVVFTATSGGISGSSGSTNASGEATATLSTAGDPTIRTITVTATSGSLTATVNVQVAAGSVGGGPSVTMGSGTGANFQAGTLGINSPSLSSGGSTTVQAVLQQSDGALYAQPATVNFSSPCVAQGLATITNPVDTSSGIASANYVATGCSGADVITATATIGTQQLSANGTVTVAPGVIGSIIFESATPTNVALRGTGSSNNPETATVVFRVLDQAGGPRVGTTVNFTLNTTVGGISVSPASAVSGADGRVQTVVQGGTVATTVRVTATVQGVTPVLATQSSQLTVTTGIPDQDSFSLAVQCPNVEAWNRDGVVVPVTARLSDRFNNPVPNGTAVTFQTEGGSIISQCQTGGGTGSCSVNWTSSNPRPAAPPSGPAPLRAGRSTVLATAIGEESFSDTNGNGSFDNGENFVDMPERFLDENESDARDGFEPIYDFNNNSSYDLGDGIFNGVLCLDNTGRCGTQVTTGISADNLIIMSGSTPANVAPANGTTLPLVTPASSESASFLFADLNDNPLAEGTSIEFSVAGNGLSLGDPSSFDVPCTTEPTSYPVTVIATGAATSGMLTVEVTSPSGLVSILTYPIN